MAAITRFSKIAAEQAPFANLPGGGITSQGSPATAGYNDAGLELGDVKVVTAVYQMAGNEAANDLINVYLLQPNEMLDPAQSSVSQRSPGTTMTLNIGDDDTTGAGIVTGLNNNAATRYASGINSATGQTNPVAFAGGDALTDPYQVGTLAVEPQGSSAGTGIAGAWVQAKFATLVSPTAGGCLIFRLSIVKP